MPRKLPIDLVVLKGKKHLTKNEIEERKATEVKAKNDNIRPPTFLPSNLKREFKKISQELVEIGIMSNLDCDALARYLTSQQMYENITTRLLDIDPLDEDYETLMKHQDKFFKQARQSASDLGLTISSRCKLVMPKKKEEDKPKSKEEKLFGDV